MTKKIKDFLSLLLRLGLSIGLLVYLFQKIDVPKTLEVLKGADVVYLCLALGVMFVLYAVGLWRWYVFIRALKIPVSLRSVTRGFLVGAFFNLFLPTSTGGDIFKTIEIFHDTNEKTKVVASVVLDRVFGLVTIVSIAAMASFVGFKATDDRFLFWAVILLSVVTFVGVLILFHERLYARVCQLFQKAPRLRDNLMDLHYDMALIKGQGRVFVATILQSFIAQFFLAASFYLTARALHQDVNLFYCVIFVPLICIASSFPSIGGLGVRDWSTVLLFAKVGLEKGTAMSMSLINFFLMAIIGLIGAGVYVGSLSYRRLQRRSQGAAL